MGQQSAKDKRQEINELIEKLSDISRKIDGEKDKKQPEFIYNDCAKNDVKPDPEEKGGEETSEVSVKEYASDSLYVKLYEDIDIKDVSKESKFTIRILNKDDFYVDIDMFAYRDIVLDNEKSEEEFITSKIERIVGINSNIDKAVKTICDYLSKLCYQKDLQIKRYRELGWDFYNGMRIFKYDRIYCVSKDGYEIEGECENEVADGLINKNDTAEDYEDWRVDFSRIMSYSDMDALIIATACTGVVRQLLPYTKENNINMNIVGKRASGKSIISHFALSMFGDPMMLEGSFTDTDNAMEKIRAERQVLPYILDERMLKIEGKSEASKRQALLMDIFREYEGKVKERLAGQGKELSGKRTYGPIISSSVEPILDKLLEESRDLGQYRRFIELNVEKEDLFKDSIMAESTEEVAYTHYGHGIFMMVNYLVEKLAEDESFVVDIYNDINSIISVILHEVEEKKKIKGMLHSSSKRFALIVTTLEVLLKAVEEESVSGIQIGADRGWIGNNLDKGDLDKIGERVDKENEDKWESSYLGKSVKSYLNNGEPFHTISENVLGILIDNLIKKMKRLKPDIDIYENIKRFTETHKNLFYTGTANWKGTDDHIGWFTETEEEIVIQIRINLGVEWVLVYGNDLSDDELGNCMKKLKEVKKKNEIEDTLREVFGDVVLGNFENLVASEYKDRIVWYGKKKTSGNYVLAKIGLNKRIIDSRGMKDSDAKEDKENNA